MWLGVVRGNSGYVGGRVSEFRVVDSLPEDSHPSQYRQHPV